MVDIARFQELGFSKNEVSVYLSLLEHGACSAYSLAKRLFLPRSTVYSVLEALEGRRLVRRSRKDDRKKFFAEHPQRLGDQLVEEERRLQQRRSAALQLAEELTPLVKTRDYELPKIEFFEGRKKVEQFLYENMERWRDSILRYDSCSWGYQDHTFVEEFSDWIKKAWVVFHRDGKIFGKILSNRSSIEQSLRGKVPRREVRALRSGITFESNIWVMGAYVVVIMCRRSPVYAFHLYEPLLAGNLRALFQNLYQQAEQVER